MDFDIKAVRYSAIAVVALALLGIGALLASFAGGAGDPEPVPTVTVTVPGPTVTIVSEPLPDIVDSLLGTDEYIIMPDLIGWELQDAQDHLQALGSYKMDQQDASGDGRLVLWDRNWKVCSQRPVSGVQVEKDIEIHLYVVKNEEECP